MTQDELDALGAELLVADETGDPRLLAALAWRFYAEIGVALAELDRVHGRLRSARFAPDTGAYPTIRSPIGPATNVRT